MIDQSHRAAEWRNLFGVCAALGEDIGFDPLWLRIALSVGLIWNWQAVIVLYAALALVVLIARVAIREPKRSASVTPLVQPAVAAPQAGPLARAA